MIVKSVFTTTANLTVEEMYDPDQEGMLMRYLTSTFVGYCLNQMLITKILRIVKCSVTRIQDTNNTAEANKDVTYEAEGITLVQGEVICGARITNVDMQPQVETKHITGSISFAPLSGYNRDLMNQMIQKMKVFIKVGKVIPIIVNTSGYALHSDKITVMAAPLVPITRDNTYYKIERPLDLDEYEKLEQILERHEEERAALEKCQDYAKFMELLYPFKVAAGTAGTAGAPRAAPRNYPQMANMTLVEAAPDKLAKLTESASMIQGSAAPSIILFSPAESYHMMNLPIYIVKDTQLNPQFKMITVSAMAAFSAMAEAHILYLSMVRNVCEYYSSDSKRLLAEKEFWQLYNNLKEVPKID